MYQGSFGSDHGLDGVWRTLKSFAAEGGALRDGRRLFRVDVEGLKGNDGNVFDLTVSTKPQANAKPWGLKMFSYLPTFRVPDDETLIELRFRVPKSATALTVHNYDASGGAMFFTSRYRSVRLVSSGQGVWDKSTIKVSADERGALAAITVAGGAEIPNDLSVYITDASGAAVPMALPLRAWAGNARPVISALASPRGCGGMAFDAAGTTDADGNKLSYLWRFSDGRVSQGAQVARKFSPDQYSARLEVRDGSGLVGDGAVQKLDFKVKARPMARTSGPTIVAQGAPVRFDGSGSTTGAGWTISNYAWTFPQGPESGPVATHVFAGHGPRMVRLEVRDSSGHPCDSAKAEFGVWVNAAPVAMLQPQARVAVGESIIFDSTGSSDVDGDVLEFSWNFGDGATATGPGPSHAYAVPGEYRVVLAVDDGAGVGNAVARETIIVQVNAPPVARPGPDMTVTIGQKFRFNGAGSTDADGNILSYQWDFGNGRRGAGVAPIFAYAKTGQYRVRLTVADDAGLANSTGSATMVVRVVDGANLAPVADAGISREVIVGTLVTFDATGSKDPDGNLIAYDWDFGDGGRATGLTPTHSFWRTGKYDVRLTVRDDSGLANASASTIVTLRVIDQPNIAPIAHAGPDRAVTVGEIITFNGYKSTDPDGNIVAYNWNFGNGHTATGIRVQYAYPKAGRYVAILTVTDDSGLANAKVEARVKVQVSFNANAPPLAVAGADVSAAIGQVVAFDAGQSSDEDGNLIAYSWNLGDGAADKGLNVEHVYTKSGTYKVTLSVRDDSGRPNDHVADQLTVRVNQPPVANAGPDQRVTASVVRFNGAASGDADGKVTTYKWDFGDGGSGTGPAPAHVYRRPGIYTIALTVGDDSGTIRNTATDTVEVLVNALPISDAGPQIAAAPGEAIAFDGSGSLDPDGQIAGYDWDFGDGVTAQGKTVEHTFQRPGTYNVVLKVRDDTGHANAVDYSQALVIINHQPTADAGGDISAAPGQPVVLNADKSFDPDGEIVEYRWDIADHEVPRTGAQTLTGTKVRTQFAKPGLYEIQLTVSDASQTLNGVARDTMIVRINNPPVAEAGPDIIGDDPRVVFDASNSADPDDDGLTYRWDFGDGTTALGARVTHTYSQGGAYPVVLSVDDNTGLANARDTDTLTVEINQGPIAVAGKSRDVCTGDVVVFDGGASRDPEGGALKYLWRFGDGSDASVVNPTRVFDKSGVFPVTLTVRDNSGLSNSAHSDRISVRVQPAPVADAGPDRQICANTRVQFDGSRSTDLDGVVNRFSWDFGDGARGGGDKPWHVFRQPGTYRVSLNIEGDQVGVCANTATDQLSVQVVVAPVAAYSAPASTPVGAPTLFDASASSSTGSTITGWLWDFGDGNQARGQNITHSFAEPGRYLVTLTIQDDNVAKACRAIITSREIVVNAPPVADAGPNQEVGTGGQLSFDGSASRDPDGGIVAYVWDFGDGQTATGLQTTHTYRAAGKYTVTLTVRDDSGLENAQARATMLVEVRDPPATLASGPSVGCAGEPMEWAAKTPTPQVGDGTQISWNFGDGATAQGPAATHAYRRAGRYLVTMFTDASSRLSGSRRFSTAPVQINQPPVASAGPDRLICPGAVVTFDASGSRDFDGALQSFRWDFGDGTTSDLAKPVHAFQEPGIYTVRLTVNDGTKTKCSTGLDQAQIVVNSPPLAKIVNARLAYVGGANDAFLLDGSASKDETGDALSYEWTVGQTILYGERVRHVFNTPGQVPVTLTVRDGSGLACGVATDKAQMLVRRRT
ncbi:MAG: PKD domain-containing protein [Alphaproteobacteria bacterium]